MTEQELQAFYTLCLKKMNEFAQKNSEFDLKVKAIDYGTGRTGSVQIETKIFVDLKEAKKKWYWLNIDKETGKPYLRCDLFIYNINSSEIRFSIETRGADSSDEYCDRIHYYIEKDIAFVDIDETVIDKRLDDLKKFLEAGSDTLKLCVIPGAKFSGKWKPEDYFWSDCF